MKNNKIVFEAIRKINIPPQGSSISKKYSSSLEKMVS